MINVIEIKPKFLLKDYFKVNLILYSKIPYLWFIPLPLLYFLFIKKYLEISEKSYIPKPSDSLFPYLEIGITIVVFILFYFSIYRSTRKQLNNNPKIKENITYVFTLEYFMEKGASFEMKHFWKNILKIEEKKDWYLAYIHKHRALVIRKEDFESNNQHQHFRELINSIDIKKKLKHHN